MKSKICHRCQEEFTVLFRVQIEKGKTWVFVCENCCLYYKQGGGYYRYGGTWKGARH